MAWVKLDDEFPDHPKMVGLSPEAGWLWVRCLAYCNRYQTDGAIPKAYAERLCGGRQRAVRELLGVGLWCMVEPNHYHIHDYLDYQPARQESAETANEISVSRSKAGSKGASARWQTGWQTDGPVPVPDPVHEDNIPAEAKTALAAPGAPAPPTPSDPRALAPAVLAEVVRDVVRYYRQKHRGKGRQLKPGHVDWKRIETRVREGFTADELKQAIDGNALDDWHRSNPAGHTVEFVFRNTTKVEAFIAQAKGPVPNARAPPKEPVPSYMKPMPSAAESEAERAREIAEYERRERERGAVS